MTGSVNMLTMCPGPKRWLSSGNGKNPSRNPHTLNPDGKDRDVRLLCQRLGHPEHLEEMGVVAAGKDPPLRFLRVCGLHRCQCIDPHQHRSTVWHAHQHRSTVVKQGSSISPHPSVPARVGFPDPAPRSTGAHQ